jgi:hypothetical protein
MKKTNQLMVSLLLFASIVMLLTGIDSLNSKWLDYVIGTTFYIGFALAILGVPLSVIGLFRASGDRRAGVIAGIYGVASLAYVVFAVRVSIQTGTTPIIL